LIALCNGAKKISQPALNRAEIRDMLLCGLIKSPESHLCQRHEWVKTVGRALHDVRLSGSLASRVNSPAYFSADGPAYRAAYRGSCGGHQPSCDTGPERGTAGLSGLQIAQLGIPGGVYVLIPGFILLVDHRLVGGKQFGHPLRAHR